MAKEIVAQIPNRYSEYIAKLPGVINANVVLYGNEIEEIHILADMSRSPKQIVRDVQSLMMAQFQKDIDHRVISIAQIDEDLNTAIKKNARIVLEGVTITKKREQTEVEVSLSLNDKIFTGKQSALKDNYDILRGTAQATLNALELATDELRNKYTVLEVRLTEIAGEKMAIVCVSLSTPNSITCRFSGTAFSLGDDNLAVVKATLSALNRKVSMN